MLELAKQAVDTATASGATYADARVIEKESQVIQTKGMNVSGLNIGNSYGIGIRVLCNGGWGFAATQDLTKDGLDRAARKAVEIAKASARCMEKPIELAAEPAHKAVWKSPCKIDPFTISVEDKLAVLLKAAQSMLAVKGVTPSSSRYDLHQRAQTICQQ